MGGKFDFVHQNLDNLSILKAYFDKLSAYYKKMFSWDHNVKWGESWFAKMGICPKS